MFIQFKQLCARFVRQDLLNIQTYTEAKLAAQEFVAAKEVMLKRFKDNGYGPWVSKPIEEKMFDLREKQ